MVDVHPSAVLHGLEALGDAPPSGFADLVVELAAHPSADIRAAAYRTLARRWPALVVEEAELDRLHELFTSAVREGALPEAMHAARALVPPAFLERGALEELHAAYRRHRTVDWDFLASLGPAPRLHLRTDHGELVVRMVPGQAPLTVQALAEQAREGLHDGTPFHRVEPNFVVQGGDVAMGDGTGGPGYALRTEITGIPFRRGAAGMAAAGTDTEGSRYFVTHSTELHLDGEMTAFGWVESGAALLDRIREGDRVVRMTVSR